MGCHVSSLKSYHHVKKSPAARDIKRYIRGGSPLGNGNCEAARSEAGMSRELCIVRTVRARKGARWVGVLEYRVPPVLYRGGVAHWVCSCVSVYCSLIHALAPKLHRATYLCLVGDEVFVYNVFGKDKK